MKKPELLAPAGDLERLKIAILYGADAVYMGGMAFGLRANATNFTLEEIKEGLFFAHERNRKVYITVNIVLHNKEIKPLNEYLKTLKEIGVDAIIASDPTVIEMAKKHGLEVHLSTQQSTLNYESALFFKELGVSRIVLGRETTKEDIALIKQKTGIEIECFIHGAMCASYSGRCVLSNYFTKRDANRGGCSQICRWNFELWDDEKNITSLKDFTFCSKDLSMLPYIDEMIEIGVDSLKIEGRMRSSYYIATVVGIYRQAIDSYPTKGKEFFYKNAQRILDACANRDSVPQFFNGVYDHTCSYYNGRVEISNQDFLGIVLDYDEKTKYVTLEQRNYFKKGDSVEFFGPGKTYTYILSDIFDEEGRKVEVARHPRQILKFQVDFPLSKNDMMRKNILNLVQQDISST